MVLACESIFYRTSLDDRPQNLHKFSKVNLKYIYSALAQWGMLVLWIKAALALEEKGNDNGVISYRENSLDRHI